MTSNQHGKYHIRINLIYSLCVKMLVDYKSKLKGETSVFMAPLQSFNNCLSEYAFAGGVCIISGKITVVLTTPYD